MTRDPKDLAAALTEAAKAINAPGSLEVMLDTIVEAAQASLPTFDHVSISEIRSNGQITTRSGTDQLVWQLDTLQYRLGEGPCVDAMRRGRLVVVPHARHDQRWPRYMPEAVQLGLKSQLAVQVYYSNDQKYGSLNLYSSSSEEIDEESIDLAEMFGVHAAIALGHARREEQLNQALVTRQVIGQAAGILMARHDIDSDRAFQFLVRTSSTSQRKVRDIARDLVETENARDAR